MTENKKQVLSDHKRHKKKLIPPLIHALGGGYSPYSWARELVPEFLWIALIIERFGEHSGVELCNNLAMSASEICRSNPKPLFARASSFSKLTDDERTQLWDSFDENSKSRIGEALRPLSALVPSHPLAFAAGEIEIEGKSFDCGKLLQKLYDRHSRAAAIVMSVAMYTGLCQGKIILTKELAEKQRRDFDNIADYPDTDASRAAASSFRAAIPMFLAEEDPEEKDPSHLEWLDEFWSAVAKHGECILENMTESDGEAPEDPFGNLIFRYRAAAKKEFENRLHKWEFDLNRIEKHEVVSALLARQLTLALDMSLVPPAWNPNTAPLLLRAMADVFIALAWIVADPQKRAEKFIEDGIGQIKLEIAHRKNQLETEPNEDEKRGQIAYLKHLESWLQSQRVEDLVEVNLGSWSGISTRKMAEEADCLDFYNFVYQPFSASVHSSWAHIGRANTAYCENPSHRYHKVGIVREFEPDAHWLYLSAKYLQKTFSAFDRFTGMESDEPSAFELLCEGLQAQ